jgi:aspartyl-tRNA(Asn)/glutamyl-tRNA(Gln) amidotransferase subunit C
MAHPLVNRELVAHVARLANVSLSEDEMDRFAADLAQIVRYVENLDAVDTRDVPPTSHVLIGRTPMRTDTVGPCLSLVDALSQAPMVESNGFAVPPFVG